MMKTNNNLNTDQGRRGAALAIALMAAVIVMLAATLLIGLTRKMVKAHIERLNSAQIVLSESSAADGLAYLLSSEGPGAATEPLSFELASVSTDFTLLESGTAGIRTGFYPIPYAERALIIPAGSRLISAQPIDRYSVRITFYSGETFQSTSEFVLETDFVPSAGIPFTFDGEEGAIVVFEGVSKALLCVVTASGIQAQTLINNTVLSFTSQLSAGTAADGSPLLIVTGGSNTGTLYNCLTGQTQNLGSPSGTCPTFLPDGTLFGSFSESYSNFGAAHIQDVFGGDFNNDGREDIAFATRFSLSVFSAATGNLYRNAPGGSLTTWGSVDGRMGLCGMWHLPNGDDQWFRLGYDGFTEFTPELSYFLGWQGRFYGSGNTLTGFIDGSAVVASSSGYILELLTGELFSGDADGGEIDFFQITEDGIEAFFNPVNGDGISLSFSTENSYRGETGQGETHIFSIYESDGERRVFHSLEGLDK